MVWLPGIDTLVHQTVKSFVACQANTTVHHRDPFPIQELPRGPWTELSLDFADPFRDVKYAMVVVDDFSKYPVVSIIHKLSAPIVFKQLRNVFTQVGSPEIVKSDNGPPLQSESFAEFASGLAFKHHHITLRWPEASGKAERFMRTLKKALLEVVSACWIGPISFSHFCWLIGSNPKVPQGNLI